KGGCLGAWSAGSRPATGSGLRWMPLRAKSLRFTSATVVARALQRCGSRSPPTIRNRLRSTQISMKSTRVSSFSPAPLALHARSHDQSHRTLQLHVTAASLPAGTRSVSVLEEPYQLYWGDQILHL